MHFTCCFFYFIKVCNQYCMDSTELNISSLSVSPVLLQRSLPALRQMTPDSEAFIHQSLLPQTSTPAAAAASSTALTAVVLRPPLSTAATTATSTAATKTTVISLTQTPHSKPGLVSLLLVGIYYLYLNSGIGMHLEVNTPVLVCAFILFLILCLRIYR